MSAADEDQVKVDAIVVGGGPAGLAAALTMAREGLEVIVVERGEYAGAKNVGGLVYGTMLEKLIPDAFEKAPIERPVSHRSICYLGEGQHMGIEFGADEWSKPPYNNTWVVNRSQFDRWFAQEVEAAGASLLEGMLVDDLLYEGEGDAKKVVGVNLRGDEQFYADVVILADGANSLISNKAREAMGMKPGKHLQDFAVGVKEIISLPKERIEDRFHLSEHEGAALDFIGTPFEGMIGGGFIYTAKETVHVGVAARIETLVEAGRSPNQLIDAFKQHPMVRKYLEGGELLEYSAHMLPEGGYSAVGDLTANGLMIVGDAAGLLNFSLYKEGTNHAMESGMYAGQAAIAARKAEQFSKADLADFEKNLADGIAMEDLKKYAKLPDILSDSPGLLSTYPKKATQLMVDYFTVSAERKSVIQKRAVKTFLKDLPKWQLIQDMLKARKLL
jgi:electron transfer flavoprotein-quinone oxidoreductase